MKKILLLIIILTIFSPINYINAQFQDPIDGITISYSPEKPGPNDDVVVEIESYLIDLNSASIVWSVNGKEYVKGIGIKKIKIIAPQAGKKTQIIATINSNNGKVVQKGITIKSGSVEIIWETPRAYTPPFFNGKNQIIYENFIRLIAMPHLSIDGVKEIDAKNLIYKWKLNGKNIENGSGYGIQSVEIPAGEIPKLLDIYVEVYTKDQSENAIKTLRIEPQEANIDIYEISPLYGILFNKALSNIIDLENSEMTILAAPYGFNYNPKNNKINYIWSINGIEQSNLSQNQSITLKSKSGSEGSSNINIDIRNENAILERAIADLKINFKKKRSVDSENIKF